MADRILLYLNLRSKQMVRVLAGIGTVPVSVSYRYCCHSVLCFYESNMRMDIASVLSAHTLAVS